MYWNGWLFQIISNQKFETCFIGTDLEPRIYKYDPFDGCPFGGKNIAAIFGSRFEH